MRKLLLVAMAVMLAACDANEVVTEEPNTITIEQMSEHCWIETDSEAESVRVFHFRYPFGAMAEFKAYERIYRVDGVTNVYPSPYRCNVTKADMYSWDEIIAELGITDRLLILKKPFDSVEVKQVAAALTKKWNLANQTRHYEEKLKKEINISKERLSLLKNRTRFLKMR